MFDVMWQLPKGELFSTLLILADCCILSCVSCHSQNSCTCKEEESKICSLPTQLILSKFRRRSSVFFCICWMPVYKIKICGRLKKTVFFIGDCSWGVNWIHEYDRGVYLLNDYSSNKETWAYFSSYLGPTCRLGSTRQQPPTITGQKLLIKMVISMVEILGSRFKRPFWKLCLVLEMKDDGKQFHRSLFVPVW